VRSDLGRMGMGWVAEHRLAFDRDEEDASSRVAWIRAHLDELAAVPAPASGATVTRFQVLASLAAIDGSLGRLAEGHLDALAIRRELSTGDGEPSALWGVWAARPAKTRAARRRSGWRLSGVKPWCSGVDLIDKALVTAVDDEGAARLFVVDVDRLSFADDWRPLGMRATASCTAEVEVDVELGCELGPPEGYVRRPGFWHGGIGVAACWHGLAGRVALELVEAARAGDDPYRRTAAGLAVTELAKSRTLLAAAGRWIDDNPLDEDGARHLAGLVRVAVESSSRRIVEGSVTAQGAGALCFDPGHARAIADLTVYLRQLHPGHDPAAIELGRPAEAELDWWSL
jgi:alkylation response protein AidB-like acyl-CoA dehydrogenase